MKQSESVNLMKFSVLGGPHIFVGFTSKKSTSFSKMKIQKNRKKKTHLILLEGREESDHFEIRWECSPWQIPTSSKKDFSRALFLFVEGHFLDSSSFQPSFLTYGKGENEETLVKVAVQKHRLTKTLKLNHIIIDKFLCPIPYHCISGLTYIDTYNPKSHKAQPLFKRRTYI